MKIKTPRLTITTFSLDMAQAVYENSQDDGPFVYPIITNDGNQNIGYIQLCKVELEEEETWEIGYHIAKNFTGKGYATEAVKAFLAAMAKKLNIKEIYGICLAENTASVRVLEKLQLKLQLSTPCFYKFAGR